MMSENRSANIQQNLLI